MRLKNMQIQLFMQTHIQPGTIQTSKREAPIMGMILLVTFQFQFPILSLQSSWEKIGVAQYLRSDGAESGMDKCQIII
jgi:hypothetical protein